MSKKGVSDIITTVLIILLVLAAIVIVWQAVNKTITNGVGQIAPKMACVDISLTAVSANYTSHIVTVTRNAGGDDTGAGSVGGVKILVGGTAATLDAGSSSAGGLTQLETGHYNVTSPVLTNGVEVEVAAVLADGTTICSTTATVKATA